MSAPRLLGLRVPDSADAWIDAGFVATANRTLVGALAIVFDASAADPTLEFDRAHPLGSADLDGVGWSVVDPGDPDDSGTAAEAATATTPHPNGIDATDHVVVMAPDLDRVRTSLLEAGLEIRRERPTHLGGTAVTQLFALAGSVLLEVVAPQVASGDGPSVVWGISFESHDLDATVAWFGNRSGRPRDAVQSGRRIATVRHRELGITLPIAVMSARSTPS